MDRREKEKKISNVDPPEKRPPIIVTLASSNLLYNISNQPFVLPKEHE